MEEIKERISKLEMKRSSAPPAPKYQHPNDDSEDSEWCSNSINAAAPPSLPQKETIFSLTHDYIVKREYIGVLRLLSQTSTMMTLESLQGVAYLWKISLSLMPQRDLSTKFC